MLIFLLDVHRCDAADSNVHTTMDETALYFTGPRTVERRSITVGDPDVDEVIVETSLSAISAGTERLVYRNEVPQELAADETIEALDGDLSYPLQYGYAAVGDVVETGESVDDEWMGRTVFAFVPHQSKFSEIPDSLVSIPPDLSMEAAAFLPSIETAITFVHDAAPRLGERIVVFGAGVIGLCTTRLLASFPLEQLTVVEPLENRRELAAEMGADVVLHPDVVGDVDTDADHAIELSGRPETLDDAIRAVGYDGRIVVGSWYGTKRAPVDFGSKFHRNRIELVSSQVSTLDPELRGRWDRDRRLETALEWVRQMDVERLISHRIPFKRAPRAYELLDEEWESVLQPILTYR